MNGSHTILVLVVATFLAGCETTGGTIGGLFPAPKFTSGEIRNNLYTAQDKSFSVAIPHAEASYEYKYMKLKEQQGQFGWYVSFGPAAFDGTIYRLETARRGPPGANTASFEDKAKRAVEGHKVQLQEGFGVALKEVRSQLDKINGNDAYYVQLLQAVPAEKHPSKRATTFRHEVYVIDFPKAGALVWVQIPETTQVTGLNARQFAESVVIH